MQLLKLSVKAFFLILILLIGYIVFKTFFYQPPPKAHAGYQLEWSFSIEKPEKNLSNNSPWTSPPVFDEDNNIYFCAGYFVEDSSFFEIFIFKINPNGEVIWNLQTGKACKYLELQGDYLFVGLATRNRPVDVIDTKVPKILKRFPVNERLAKTHKWIYTLSPDGIFRINPHSLETTHFKLNPKSFVAREDRLFFVLENKAFMLNDNAEKPTLIVADLDKDQALLLNNNSEKSAFLKELEDNHKFYHLFPTKDYLCIPYEDTKRMREGKTICYHLETGEKVNLVGSGFGFDRRYTYENKIILRNIFQEHPQYGSRLYDLDTRQERDLGIYSQWASLFYDNGNLYNYYSRNLDLFDKTEQKFKKVFSGTGNIRHVQEHNNRLYIATSKGRLHAISKTQ